MPPYVGMARKQNGGYNASISVQTPIVHLVVNSTHLKTVRSALCMTWPQHYSDLHPVRLHPIRRLPFSRIIKYSLVQSGIKLGGYAPPRPPT